LEFDTYVLVGPVEQCRTAICALHSQHSDPSPLAPWTWVEAPAPGDTVRATATVSGWVWGLSPVTSVVVLIDRSEVATATLGLTNAAGAVAITPTVQITISN